MLSDDEINKHALVWGAAEPVEDGLCLRLWCKLCMLLANKKQLEN